MNLQFSVIIPVYNRPDEVDELLHSLTKQSNKNFEVIIIEDGSDLSSESVVEGYRDRLEKLIYEYIPNGGPGPARNKGASLAKGDWLVFFDSDCNHSGGIISRFLPTIFRTIKLTRLVALIELTKTLVLFKKRYRTA